MSNAFESGTIEQRVRARAYAIWESEGRPNGRDAEHWLRSMEEVQQLSQRTLPEAPAKVAKKARAKKAGKPN